jgi:hypothetical protein
MVTLLKWKSKLQSKMIAEEIKDFSDAEINRVFAGCVAKNRCIKYARDLIDTGLLTLKEVTK